MTFYIKVEDNQPVGDVFVDSNLKRVITNHDWDSGLPPSGYMECEISGPPNLDIYEKWDDTYPNKYYYQIVDDKVKKIWAVVNLTDDEKKTLQDQVKADWAALDLTGYESWTFDEDICAYKPPSIYPNDGKDYEWDTTNQEWKELIWDGT